MATPGGVVGKRAAPLAVTEGFRALVLDNLNALPELSARPMFGAIGLYSGGVFFGIVAADTLYLRVDAESLADYLRRGALPFEPFPGKPASNRYFAVPAGILEHPADLVAWARRAVRAASSSPRRSRKPAR